MTLNCTHCSCFGPQGLELFTVTADERWALGTDLFVRTHVPIGLKRQGSMNEWAEDDLLAAILTDHRRGNRVFAIYGATGSGKSEVLRWLHHRLEDLVPHRAPATIRLSRTDLGAPALVQRLAPLLSNGSHAAALARRWDELRRAPVALTNALLWSALGRLIPDDERCLPLGYALRPLVERAMRGALGGPAASRAFDLLWSEDLRQARIDHPVLAEIEEESLRSALLEAFDTLVLPTPNVGTLLTDANQGALDQGIRPILLVDDLVQALPTHAADILDWVTTLDNGSWDVVVGLTPGSLRDEPRTRHLLDRITHLSTFDDRMTKLWLTDESGHTSYALSEDGAIDLLRAYLSAYRAVNGRACRCTVGPDEDLWPLTRAIVRRLYHSTPPGKGIARHLLTSTRSILMDIIQGAPIDMAVAAIVPPEAAAQHPEPVLRRVLETYGTLRAGRLVLAPDIARRLGLDGQRVTARAEVLYRVSEAEKQGTDAPRETDLSTVSIREWLTGMSPNPQGLHAVRLGIARFARYARYNLGHPGSSRPAALRLLRTRNNTCPGVGLVGLDDDGDLLIGSWIGNTAYELARLARADASATQTTLRRILSTPVGARLIWAVRDTEARVRREIDAALGLPLPQWVAAARYLSALIWGPSTPPIPVLDQVTPLPFPIPGALAPGQPLRTALDALAADMFLLRENAWDGMALTHLLGHRKEDILYGQVQAATWDRPDAAFRVGDEPLRNLVRGVQEAIKAITVDDAQAQLDARIGGLVCRLHDGETATTYSTLLTTATICSLAGARWQKLGEDARRVATLLSNVEVSTAFSPLSVFGDASIDRLSTRVRRRTLLAETISPAQWVLLVDAVTTIDACNAQSEPLSVDLHAWITQARYRLAERASTICGFTSSGRSARLRSPTRSTRTVHLTAIALSLNALGRTDGVLDRLELALYQGMLGGQSMRSLRRLVRRATIALQSGRLTTALQHWKTVEADLETHGLGAYDEATYQRVRVLRSIVPAPQRWVRPLLHALLEDPALPLHRVDKPTQARLARVYPEMHNALCVCLPLGEAPAHLLRDEEAQTT